METLTEKIFKQALDLPIDDRLALIDKLLISSNLQSQEDINSAWAKEVEVRVQSFNNGKAKIISGDVVFQKIAKRLSK